MDLELLEKFSTDVCWLFTNNELLIYEIMTLYLVVNLGHFSPLMLKLE
jgi:hypothetical protein